MKRRMRATLTAMAGAFGLTGLVGCGGGSSGTGLVPAANTPATGTLTVNSQVSRQDRDAADMNGTQLTIDGTQVTGTFDANGHLTMTNIPAGMHTMSLVGANGMPNASNIPFEMPQQPGAMLMDMLVGLDAAGQLESVTCTYAPDADGNGAMDPAGGRHTKTLPDGSYAMHNADSGQTQRWHGGMMNMFADMNGDFMPDASDMAGAGMSGSSTMGGGM